MYKIKHNKLELDGFHTLVFGKDGTFLANQNDIYVGGALITYGEFSHLEMEYFSTIIDKDTTVIEIGANIGAHTVGLAKQVKRVIAIEPQPFIFYTLCANVALNSLQNVICINAGCGAEAGSLHMPDLDYSQPNNYGGVEINRLGYNGQLVDILTLDSIVKKYSIIGKVFLKIDVEGMEEEVLRGGTEFIKTNKPIMYLENDRVDKSDSLISYIEELGYNHMKHHPYLYNSSNFFGKKENKYEHLVSINEICTPKETI
jgi:FkbM family methyltransferase